VPFKGEEETWRIKVVEILAVPGKCTRRFARSAKKNAKFLSNPEKAEDLSYAENATARAKVRIAK